MVASVIADVPRNARRIVFSCDSFREVAIVESVFISTNA